MKKPTKSKPRRQPRSPRSSRKRRSSPVSQVLDLRQQIREGLLEEIRGAVCQGTRYLIA